MKHLIRSTFRTTLLSVAALLSVASCVNKNRFFGNNIVPPSQEMHTAVDSTLQVKSYNISSDSIIGSNVYDYLLVGRHVNPISGELFASGFSNYMPGGFPDDTYFGTNAQIDSMNILLNLSLQDGDTTMGASTLKVYEVTGYNFKKDSTYYSNFDMRPYINPEPIYQAEVPASGGQVTGNLPIEFAKKFLDNVADADNIYNQDTLFHKKFNGLYFELEPAKGNAGAIYSISTLSESSRMFLYYSNDDYPDSTLVQRMFFESPDENYVGFNTSLIMFDRDYTKADVSQGGVDYRTVNDTINPQAINYVFAPAGVSTRVELVSSMIDSLKQQAKDQGYDNIALHKAELSWTKVDQSYDAMTDDLTGIGMYFSFSKAIFMPDYDYAMYAYDSNNFPLTLGGMLNRMSGRYVQDITRYVQSYLAGTAKYMSLEMAPLTGDRYSYLNTEIYGSEAANAADRPKLVLTYTLTK